MDDREVVTYCGLCCLDCHGYSGRIADLARDLRKELRAAKYDKFAAVISEQPFGAAFRNYPECYELLGQMLKFRCRKGCRAGGGPPFCGIRKCCTGKGIEGCWECQEINSCGKLDFLNGTHGDAHRKNLEILRKKGITAFVKGKRNW
ncbi:MAG: DUF3795 domain-containing protein [Methanoregulaceae archaeon]|nr:DUF3795 domain-containing protein [Methanoregulaceae archaeon]